LWGIERKGARSFVGIKERNKQLSDLEVTVNGDPTRIVKILPVF